MEPLNTAERKKAFGNFLTFFLVTTALIVAAVLFSIQVPFSQNRQLTQQMKVVEAERDLTQKFERNMNDVMRLFDSSNKPGVNVTLIDGKIEDKIKAMSGMIDSDSTLLADPSSPSVKDLYTSVVSSLGQYHAAKRELREATMKDANLSEYKRDINDLKAQISMKDQQLVACNVQLQLAARTSSK